MHDGWLRESGAARESLKKIGGQERGAHMHTFDFISFFFQSFQCRQKRKRGEKKKKPRAHTCITTHFTRDIRTYNTCTCLIFSPIHLQGRLLRRRPAPPPMHTLPPAACSESWAERSRDPPNPLLNTGTCVFARAHASAHACERACMHACTACMQACQRARMHACMRTGRQKCAACAQDGQSAYLVLCLPVPMHP